MLKSGIVIDSNKNYTTIMTNEGEFYKLETNNNKHLRVGEIYSEETKKPIPLVRYFFLCLIALCVIVSSALYFEYNQTSYSVIMEMNFKIALKINSWNKIIGTSPLDNDGSQILIKNDVINKSLDDGLYSLLVYSKNNNLIDRNYLEGKKPLSIYVSSHKNKKIKFTSFKRAANNFHIKYVINDNGNEIK